MRALGGTTDPQIKNLLDQFRAAPDTDPELRQAADAALASIENRLRLVGLAANLFQGISLGSMLLLAAIGLAITFGVMGVINMAHGEMIMLGRLCRLCLPAIVPRVLAAGVDRRLSRSSRCRSPFCSPGRSAIALERSVIRFLYGRPLETLLATWGVSLILQQAVRSIFGSPNKEVSNPSWMTGGFDPIGGFTITWNRLVIIVFCFVVLGVLALVLNRTRFGLHMRAVTQNRAMASVMGIRSARIDALTFGLGSGIAGMAGVALSQIGNVSPNLGTIYIVDSFLVVVFGGVGNLMGTLVGALSLGIVNKFLEPVAGAILGKIVVLVAIILFIQRRPRGLFALQGPNRRGGGLMAVGSIGACPQERLGSGLLGAAFSSAASVLARGACQPLNVWVPPNSAAALPDYLVPLLGKYLCYALLALSLDLIWGYAGILSLGHGAFFALGGYCMGMYLMRQIGTRGVYGNPLLPDFMVFLNWQRAAVVLVGLRPFRLGRGDGRPGSRHCSRWFSAGSPFAPASPASICRSSRRR